MEESITYARPYALAAWRQAEREGAVEAWSEALELLAVVVQDPDLARLTADPRVTVSQIVGLVCEVCGDRLSPTMANFVRVLGVNRRLPIVPVIAQLFERERAKSAGRSAVEIVSAFALEPSQTDALTEQLASHLGRQVTVETSVDDSLIGGVIIRIGDAVIDASLKGRLRELEHVLV